MGEPVGRESEAHPAFCISKALHLGKFVRQIVLGDQQSGGKIITPNRRSPQGGMRFAFPPYGTDAALRAI